MERALRVFSGVGWGVGVGGQKMSLSTFLSPSLPSSSSLGHIWVWGGMREPTRALSVSCIRPVFLEAHVWATCGQGVGRYTDMNRTEILALEVLKISQWVVSSSVKMGMIITLILAL